MKLGTYRELSRMNWRIVEARESLAVSHGKTVKDNSEIQRAMRFLSTVLRQIERIKATGRVRSL